jgi:hypothetical protein
MIRLWNLAFAAAPFRLSQNHFLHHLKDLAQNATRLARLIANRHTFGPAARRENTFRRSDLNVLPADNRRSR